MIVNDSNIKLILFFGQVNIKLLCVTVMNGNNFDLVFFLAERNQIF